MGSLRKGYKVNNMPKMNNFGNKKDFFGPKQKNPMFNKKDVQKEGQEKDK